MSDAVNEAEGTFCCLRGCKRVYYMFFILTVFLLSYISLSAVSTLASEIKVEGRPGARNELHEIENGETSAEITSFPNGRNQKLHVFMQISDLHFSRFWDPHRQSDMRELCSKYIDVIKPEVVLASGDLTDAKFADHQGSKQYEDEWQMYEQLLTSTGVLSKTVWLDIRGNHDAFDVPSLTSGKNFYRKYSVQGRKVPASYKYEHKTVDGTYTFIGVDTCPDPGPRRPFNFIGVLAQGTAATLEMYAKESKNSNMTIWFGHYPTSVVANSSQLRDILSHGAVYLCGHLHTLGGLVPKMYTMHKGGNLELEVGDWKDNRIFRIMAVDHGLFSFVDVTYNKFPYILITNPKHASFHILKDEPTGVIAKSTHIRVLVFSDKMIREVRITVDGELLGEAKSAGDSLFVLKWQPSKYSTGLHKISVLVKDSDGKVGEVQQPFSVDGTLSKLGFLPRLLLTADITSILQLFFILSECLVILPLVISRLCRNRCYFSVSSDRWVVHLIVMWIRRFRLLSDSKDMFYSLMAFNLYVAVGPWFIGELLEGHIGACFVYGLFVNGAYIPGTLTYAYGFFQVMTFNFPLTLYLGKCLDESLKGQKFRHNKRDTCQQKKVCDLIGHSIFYCLIIWQIYLAYTGFFKAYGGVAFLLCPIRTWSIFIAFLLRMRAMRGHCSLSFPCTSSSESNEDVTDSLNASVDPSR